MASSTTRRPSPNLIGRALNLPFEISLAAEEWALIVLIPEDDFVGDSFGRLLTVSYCLHLFLLLQVPLPLSVCIGRTLSQWLPLLRCIWPKDYRVLEVDE